MGSEILEEVEQPQEDKDAENKRFKAFNSIRSTH